MAISRVNFAFSVLLVALFLASSRISAFSDAPFVVAHKKVNLNRLQSGSEQVSVSIDIYNRGSATAYDVSLTDDSWTKDIFNLLHGNISKTWERLDANSVVSHSFTLESKVKGIFYGAPAVINFRIPSKTALQVAYTTPVFGLDILADRAPEKKFELVKMLLAKYGSLVSVVSIVVMFMYLVSTPSKSSVVKGKKRR